MTRVLLTRFIVILNNIIPVATYLHRNDGSLEVIERIQAKEIHIKSFWLGQNFQTLKHFGKVKSYALGRTRTNCFLFGCGCTNLAKLSNLLTQFHKINTTERKKWLKWSKIRISVPLQDKYTNRKEINMTSSLTRQTNLQVEMARNI